MPAVWGKIVTMRDYIVSTILVLTYYEPSA